MKKIEVLEERGKMGSVIQEARIQKGRSIEELADLTNMSKSTLKRIEAGTLNANSDQILIICKVLQIPLDINKENIL
jgi:transcriptional regulator with XRE-family HTH domain